LSLYRSFEALSKALKKEEVNCHSVTQHYLTKIKDSSSLNIFIETFDKEALDRAKEIDKKIANGSAGKLAGMVIAIKDNICFKGHKVTASSKILEGYTSSYNATVIERLLDQDAIIIGRVNCDEFAMGSGNENTIYGTVKNPLDNKKVAGGSSGGSAAAVSAGLCMSALGSDTGGSIRQPAAFCGVYGLKPTYSRVSRYGLIAYASSFDQIGPITNNIFDANLILEVISGKDPYDSTSSSREIYSNDFTPKRAIKKSIAYIKEHIESPGLDPVIKSHLLDKINELRSNGHRVDVVSFPYLDYLVPTYYVISTAEASSNLSRYDGIRFGYRSDHNNDLESTYIKSRSLGFGKEVQRRIMLGTFVLSAGYHDAYFTKAQKIRRIIKDKTNDIFNEYDFIISPTTPHTAFDIGNKYSDPTQMYLEDIFTVHANLAGNPAISIPTQDPLLKMPFGMQVMANHFKEQDLLDFCSTNF
jgi:aspartyl-tRNA(Asn)/glutamyl-tRNA(Gln) amidotransferase subunit A|tara:strand:- start:7771 stop:9186 length:1416 start_codon:yes stop_codon:yes gene_type:complete